MTFFDNFNTIQLIAAHRGCRSLYPENTLAAFRASIGKCHFIELDVQLTKDNIPVIIHDPDLNRTSDAPAKYHELGLRSLKVSRWTAAQLKSLDIGSWFLDEDPFQSIQNGKISKERLLAEMPQTIMSLEEFLLHPALKRLPVNIEIKDHPHLDDDKNVTEAVLLTVNKCQAEKRVLISSFNHDYLAIAKTLCPLISTGALQEDEHPPDLVHYLQTLQVSAYHPANEIVDEQLVHQLRAAGFGVNVFTVNDRKRQLKLFSMGATAIFTDFPELSEPNIIPEIAI